MKELNTLLFDISINDTIRVLKDLKEKWYDTFPLEIITDNIWIQKISLWFKNLYNKMLVDYTWKIIENNLETNK